MSDIEFIQLGNEILNQMQYVTILSKEYKTLCEKMKKLKIHIYDYPDNNFVKDFITELMRRYIALFFNQELIDAFLIKEPFYRQIQICKNLPFNKHRDYCQFLFNLLELESYPNFYLGFKEALNHYRPELLEHPHIKQVYEFIEQNPILEKGSADKYRSLEEEQNLYWKAARGDYFEELQDFSDQKQVMGQDKVRQHFMHKRIGNIGELHIFHLINGRFQTILVARDEKNGFGYDIYYRDDNNCENLVEVKTTTKINNEEDSFEMSENEYGIMKQCVDNPQANYIVCRVKLDNKLNPISFTLLIMIDNTTMIDIANRTTQYKLYPFIGRTIQFKKYTPKVKIFTN